MTQKELLIRIDERQLAMDKRLELIEQKLIPANEHETLMKTMVDHDSRLDDLEAWRTKVVAYSAVIGSIAGFILSIAQDVAKTWLS